MLKGTSLSPKVILLPTINKIGPTAISASILPKVSNVGRLGNS